MYMLNDSYTQQESINPQINIKKSAKNGINFPLMLKKL